MTGFADLPLRERAKRSPVMLGSIALILAIILLKLFLGEALSSDHSGQTDPAVLSVCIEHIAKDQEDFEKAFSAGAIDVPSGTVFDTAGPAFGPASDPRDIEHAKQPTGWIGVSDAEATRRGALLAQALKADVKRKAGLITLSQLSLSRSQPCADVPVAAARSSEWGWTVSPVAGSQDVYYQAVGIRRFGHYDTPESGKSALDDVMVDGTLNGILHGVTQTSITIPSE